MSELFNDLTQGLNEAESFPEGRTEESACKKSWRRKTLSKP